MAEGQFTGSRGRFLYTSDSGLEYLRIADNTLASIAGTTNLPAPDGGAADGALPGRMKPRGVYWQGTLTGRVVRKFLVCGTIGDLYASVTRTALTVDGVAGFITGRRGEKATF